MAVKRRLMKGLKPPFLCIQLVVHKLKEWWVEHFVPWKLLDGGCAGRVSKRITDIFWETAKVFNEWITEQAYGLWEANP